MSTALEAAWQVFAAEAEPASIAALVSVLDRRGDLNEVKQRVLAEAAEELRADRTSVAHAQHAGKLAEAVMLIEAGAAKEVVLAKVSRRTYFRARRECQECQVTPSRSSA
jgi:cobalamin biosynthesis protein CbiD